MKHRVADGLADGVEKPLREPLACAPFRRADAYGLVWAAGRGLKVRLKSVDAPKRAWTKRRLLPMNHRPLPSKLQQICEHLPLS